jgi:hypothetical protein
MIRGKWPPAALLKSSGRLRFQNAFATKSTISWLERNVLHDMLPEYFEFSLPTKLVYGIGIIENLGETVKPLGKRKAILVTDEILENRPCRKGKKRI